MNSPLEMTKQQFIKLFLHKGFMVSFLVFQVTYMYYTGRLEVFNENFPAVSSLHCLVQLYYINDIMLVIFWMLNVKSTKSNLCQHVYASTIKVHA